MKEHLPTVVIVVGGFGGLQAAKALKRTPANVIRDDRLPGFRATNVWQANRSAYARG
jgi:NADH dehydrogenase FAD-containing subunit